MLKVTVRLDEAIPGWAQGEALLAFEQHLRQLTALDCRVLKEKLPDESPLRIQRSV